MTAILGLDLGTSAVKALVLDGDGRVRGVAQAAYALEHPRPGQAETEPRRWAEATATAVRDLLRQNSTRHVDAVGLSGQMHGVVLVDEGLQALRPAVLWPDQRAVGDLDAFRALPPALRRRLGNPVVEGMAGPTLRWFRRQTTLLDETRWTLQPKDWLRGWLTGAAGGEPSDASATLLWDLPGDRWFTELTDRLGIPARVLPPLGASAGLAGVLRPQPAEELGLRPGTPVVAGAADVAAAAVGTALPDGAVQLSVGTGGQLLGLTDTVETPDEPLIHTYRSAASHGWYRMAAVKNVGLALGWVRTLFDLQWPAFFDEAFSVPAGAEGVRFAPYLSGERTPLLDPSARGAWRGLTTSHRRAHLLRAAVDGVALAIADAFAALVAAGHDPVALRLSGGGTADPRLQQLLADVLGRSLLAVPQEHASALGAARLAGVGAGLLDWPVPTPDDRLRCCAEPTDAAAILREPIAPTPDPGRYRIAGDC